MISASVSVGGRKLGVEIASPREQKLNEACAAQDGAARSTGELGRDLNTLDRLRDDPGALGRFGAV